MAGHTVVGISSQSVRHTVLGISSLAVGYTTVETSSQAMTVGYTIAGTSQSYGTSDDPANTS
jgi:hypothetical protein